MVVPDEKPDPCKMEACRIQKCMKKNSFDEAYCFDYIDAMRRCCGSWKAQAASCDGFLRERQKLDFSPTQNGEFHQKNSFVTVLTRYVSMSSFCVHIIYSLIYFHRSSPGASFP